MNEILLYALLSLALNALFIIGLHQVTRDGYLLGFVERWWRKETLEYKAWVEDIKWKRKAVKDIKDQMHKMHDGYDHSDLSKPLDLVREFQQLAHCHKQAEYFLEENLKVEPDKYKIPSIANPISECPVCMASLWGLLGFSAFFAWWIPLPWIWAAIPYCFALAGLIWVSRKVWEEGE